MLTQKVYSILPALTFVALLSACATTTTEGTGASSGSIENTSDAFSELTSSTSGGDDEETQAAQVLRFIDSNFSRVRSDMAVGKGEYLATLASLLSIDNAKIKPFYALTKKSFNHLFVSSETTAEELVAHLHKEMTQAQLF